MLAGMVAAGVGSALGGSPARACGPLAPLSPIALPRSGATAVSTATSLIVLSRAEPTGLTLLAGGQNVALSAPVSLGGGADGSLGPASFWQVRPLDGMLPGNVEHVLTATFAGGTVEATRFTTGAGYDKVEGVAPVARAVHLWRVRYPVADIASGNCVFAEYHGFITVDYAPATVPSTPPASVVHTFRLAPETGGSAQQFSYTGEAAFTGTEPTGAYPLPTAPWQPELDPTRRYCLGISAFGDGDLARLPLQSQSVCADVVQLSAAGAPPPPGVGSGGDGGCAVAGARRARGAAWLFVAAVALARRRPRRSAT
jgi:hypothetical protein